MTRKYVTYAKVCAGLNPWDKGGWVHKDYYSPTQYLTQLRAATGLSWAKLAHDLSVDSGYELSKQTARRWAEG